MNYFNHSTEKYLGSNSDERVESSHSTVNIDSIKCGVPWNWTTLVKPIRLEWDPLFEQI